MRSSENASFAEGGLETESTVGMDDEASGFFFNFLILEGFTNEVTSSIGPVPLPRWICDGVAIASPVESDLVRG